MKNYKKVDVRLSSSLFCKALLKNYPVQFCNGVN